MSRTGVLALLCLLVMSPAYAEDTKDADDHPLLELVRERAQDGDREDYGVRFGGYYATHTSRLEHEIAQARVPAGEECAGHMAAGKFADLHAELGALHRSAGELEDAAAAYEKALSCRPRSTNLLAEHARVAMARRDISAARASIDEALRIDPRATGLNRIAGDLDFLDGRWADAAARFRYVASGAEIPGEAAAAQLMYWVTQRRAGVPKPEFAPRRLVDDWPRPVMLYLSGEYSEADLARVMKERAEPWETGVPDHWLTEALFYAGELRLARGEPDAARLHFAAVVNIRQSMLDEYSLALAEIARLNSR